MYDIDLLSIEDMQRALSEAERANSANVVPQDMNNTVDDRNAGYEALSHPEVILLDTSPTMRYGNSSTAATNLTQSGIASNRMIETGREISPLLIGGASEVYGFLSQVRWKSLLEIIV